MAQPIKILADASQSGLGACLIQNDKSIAYASRTLTSAERAYAQGEKKMLAITFVCRKFYLYIYEKLTQVESDHKPLESIMKKPLGSVPPRLQRMMLQLQRYELDVLYTSEKAIPVADAMSRAQLPTTADAHDRMNSDIEVMVHAITSSLPMSETQRDELQRATAQDEELQALRNVIFSGWPDNIKAVPSIVRPFWAITEELHEADQMLFKGTKVIIPTIFRSEMLRRIHEGHQGADKSKERARAVMYWPNMNNEIADYVSKCTTCLRFRRSNTKEPLKQHYLPERPWQMIAADIMTFKRRGYLMVVDYYSKYVEVPLLPDKTEKLVITALKSIFARHGIPERLIFDNVPFASRQVHLFSKGWGFKITTSSPEYPQSKGLAERNVQTIKQLMRKCHYEGSDPYLALLNLPKYTNT